MIPKLLSEANSGRHSRGEQNDLIGDWIKTNTSDMSFQRLTTSRGFCTGGVAQLGRKLTAMF